MNGPNGLASGQFNGFQREWNRLEMSGLAKKSIIEVFSCSIVVLQSRHENYLPLASCTSTYPAIDGHPEGSKEP